MQNRRNVDVDGMWTISDTETREWGAVEDKLRCNIIGAE